MCPHRRIPGDLMTCSGRGGFARSLFDGLDRRRESCGDVTCGHAAFAALASEFKVDLYRKHGAILGQGAHIAPGALGMWGSAI